MSLPVGEWRVDVACTRAGMSATASVYIGSSHVIPTTRGVLPPVRSARPRVCPKEPDCKCSGPERVRVAGADSARRAGARRGDNGPKAGDQAEQRSTIAASIALTRPGQRASSNVRAGESASRRPERSILWRSSRINESLHSFRGREGERERMFAQWKVQSKCY